MTLNRYGGLKTLRGEKTGYFHVEELAGKYWLVDPDGGAFFAVGANQISWHSTKDKQGVEVYHENIKKEYGTEKAWAAATRRRLRDWHFNCGRYFPGMAHYGWAPMSHTFVSDGWHPEDRFPVRKKLLKAPGVPGYMTLVDIFDPDFEKHCARVAARYAAPHRNDRAMIGYYTDNELFWGYGLYSPHSLMDAVLWQDRSVWNKRELVRFFRDRYAGDLAALRRSWQVRARRWDDLLEVKETKAGNARVLDDKRAFLFHYARRYFRVTATALRKADPRHLNLGCRIHGHVEPEMVRAMGEFVDVISYNKYDGVAPSWQMAEMFHREAGRPVLVSEWGFRGMDAGMPNTGGVGRLVATQRERGKKYAAFLEGLARSPYCVGSVYYNWVDDPPTGGGGMMGNENSNYGILNVRDEPYMDFVREVVAANRNVARWRLSPTKYPKDSFIATPKDFFKEPVERFFIQRSGRVINHDRLRAFLPAKEAGFDYSEPVFEMDFERPVRFSAWVYETEKDGILEFLLDGKRRKAFSFLAGPGHGRFSMKMPQGWHSIYDAEYGIHVPAGPHTVRVRNTGKGWLWLNGYKIERI